MADAGGFFEAAGRSLGEAQEALVGATDVPSSMAISGGSLEIKAAIDRGDDGLTIRPIGTELIGKGAIDPGLVSTLTVRFVAVAGTEAPARRTPTEVLSELRRREDVQRLAKILGDLRFEAQFVPASRRWVVTAVDAAGRTVREVLVADDA